MHLIGRGRSTIIWLMMVPIYFLKVLMGLSVYWQQVGEWGRESFMCFKNILSLRYFKLQFTCLLCISDTFRVDSGCCKTEEIRTTCDGSLTDFHLTI